MTILRHLAGAIACVLLAAGLTAVTWIVAFEQANAVRDETAARVNAGLVRQAQTATEGIGRQILAIDQTLRFLVTLWQADPKGFDLESWRSRASVLTGLSRDMILADENGTVRQSSVTEAVNQDVSDLDFFRALSQATDPADAAFVGTSTIGGTMRQWHMNVARALRYPDGSFGGAIDADYRISAVTDVLGQADLGSAGLATLVGTQDGKLRAAVGPATINPDASISDTPMFAALRNAPGNIWTGPSANDAVRRIHAFRQVPDRTLAVVVAVSEEEAMQPATTYRRHVERFAGCVTALLALAALLQIRAAYRSLRHVAALAEDRALLAASNAQIQVARAQEEAKAEQLSATLAGMSDGISVIDAHLCLVEWNERFPVVAGVPPEILQVGLPMEAILRAQIASGQFGTIDDPDAEIARRMARLRSAPSGTVQRRRPDGRTIELRRNYLQDGSFVTSYADVSGRIAAEEALRRAQAEAAAAKLEKSRLAASISQDIRAPLESLLATMQRLLETDLSPSQRSLLAMAGEAGDGLFSLAEDVVEIARLEEGALAVQPELFALRPLLDGCAGEFAAHAALKSIAIRVEPSATAPAALVADPARLRQIVLTFLADAIKRAPVAAVPATVWIAAEADRTPSGGVRLSVKDPGPAIDAEARAWLAQDALPSSAPPSLALSVCRHLARLMGGAIGWEAWSAPDGREGNSLWVDLPSGALPYLSEQTASQQAPVPEALSPEALAELAARRPLPRTRILVAETLAANRQATAMLLRREGHAVDLADSGSAAVEAAGKRPYDLVLLDVAMPGADGPETAAMIRRTAGPAGAVPVIGLATGASADDTARCAAAGMYAVLSKPVPVQVMRKAIRDAVWSPAMPRAAAATPEAGAAPSVGDDPLLDAARIEELRAKHPPEAFAEIVEECLLDIDHRMPALRRAFAGKALGSIAAHANLMTGLAATFGMAALETRLRDIAAAAREGNQEPLTEDAIRRVEADFMDSGRALRRLAQREPA